MQKYDPVNTSTIHTETNTVKCSRNRRRRLCLQACSA